MDMYWTGEVKMPYPTLEQLAQSEQPIDASEYGLKTIGLVELIRAMPELRHEDELFDVYYLVPPGFVVPLNDLDLAKLRESYFGLVEGVSNPLVLLARSSHEHEMPGKFETIPVLYNPKNPSDSFMQFLRAFRQVRANPKKPVIVQHMVGDLDYLRYDDNVLLKVPLFDDGLDYDAVTNQLRDQLTAAKWYKHMEVHVTGTKDDCTTHFEFERGKRFDGKPQLSISEQLKEFVERRRHSATHPNYSQNEVPIDKSRVYLEFIIDNIPRNPVIGHNTVAFMSRSHSYMDPSTAAINTCFGLATKLVNNPDEICIIPYREPMGIGIPISTGNDYRVTSQQYYQGEMDVFDVEKRKIVTIPFSRSEEMLDNINGGSVPFAIHDYAIDIFDATLHFSKKFGVPVELEGAITSHPETVHIFQLTKYPPMDEQLLKLTTVDPARIVLSEEYKAFGSMRFVGDIIYTDELSGNHGLEKVIESARQQGNNVLLMADNFADELRERYGINDYVRISSEDAVMHLLGRHRNYGGFIMAHVFGFLNVELYQRRRNGHNVSCVLTEQGFEDIAGKVQGFGPRAEVLPESRVITLKNAVFESAGGSFQVYFAG